jgi:hypothetical protein
MRQGRRPARLRRRKTEYFKLTIDTTGGADGLPFCIHEVRDATGVISDRSKIGHHAILPEERVHFLIPSSRGYARYLTCVVKRVVDSECSSKLLPLPA